MDALGKILLFSFNFGKIFGIILVFLRIKYNVIFDTFVKCFCSIMKKKKNKEKMKIQVM
jgi:hypothetical protein